MDGPPVRYVDQCLWRTMVRPLMVSALKLIPHDSKIRRGTDVYMPNFESNPLFGTSNTNIYLVDIEPPPVVTHFDRIVSLACDCYFGENL